MPMHEDSEEVKMPGIDRRRFMAVSALAGAAAGLGCLSRPPRPRQAQQQQPTDPDSVHSNLSTALAVPRTPTSMPGAYPGRVVEVFHPTATEGSNPNHCEPAAAAAMLAAGIKELTGEADEREAWGRFFSPGDRVGIKINPVGGKLLSNTHELLRAIIANLESVGVTKDGIVIWDREEWLLREAGYTEETYPGVRCVGMAYSVEEGGELVYRGEDRVDKSVFYEFDIPGSLDPGPYANAMINFDTRSYFAAVLTREVDKVISVPVLKNTRDTVTLCLKNMAYGSTSNCYRGHRIFNRYIAEVCAFPPVRDKVVLNIVDGLRACFRGGPMAVAKYIWSPNRIWVATDPVAADLLGWEFVFDKQVEQGLAEAGDFERKREDFDFLTRAENLGLGFARRGDIDHRRMSLG